MGCVTADGSDLRTPTFGDAASGAGELSMNAKISRFQGPHFLITAEGSLHGDDTPENRELVRRIHACVNACEGISTEELENGIIQDMCRALQQVIPLLQQQGVTTPSAVSGTPDADRPAPLSSDAANAAGASRSPAGEKAVTR